MSVRQRGSISFYSCKGMSMRSEGLWHWSMTTWPLVCRTRNGKYLTEVPCSDHASPLFGKESAIRGLTSDELSLAHRGNLDAPLLVWPAVPQPHHRLPRLPKPPSLAHRSPASKSYALLPFTTLATSPNVPLVSMSVSHRRGSQPAVQQPLTLARWLLPVERPLTPSHPSPIGSRQTSRALPMTTTHPQDRALPLESGRLMAGDQTSARSSSSSATEAAARRVCSLCAFLSCSA